FTPNAAGGYDLTSPEGEAQNLGFTSATAFAWDARADATTYNVYRGALGSFVDSNGDGAADAYGACLDHGLVSPSDADAASPATGSGFFYLVTARNAAGEGPLGFASSGAPLPNTQPCP